MNASALRVALVVLVALVSAEGCGGGAGGGAGGGSGGGVKENCGTYSASSIQASCADADGVSCNELYLVDASMLDVFHTSCTANGGIWSTGPCAHTGVDGACVASNVPGAGGCGLKWQPKDTSACVANTGTTPDWCCQSGIDSARSVCEAQGLRFVPGTPPYPVHSDC